MKHLLIKEFTQFFRNSFLPRLVVIFPIAIICIMPWVANMEVDNINIVVVDNDHSQVSARFIDRVAASKHFILKGTPASYDEAMVEIEKSRADLVVEIPQDYAKDLSRGHMPEMYVGANAVNGTKGSLGASYVSSIIVQNLQDEMHVPSQVSAAANISTLYLYNNHLDYKHFMIPALLAMLIMILCGFLPALNIVGEKESGTIEQMNVTPVSKFSFILAKLIPYWMMAILVLSLALMLSWLVYGITPVGHLWLIYLISILLALVFSGLGLVISNYSDTMQQAIFVMWFFVMYMLLLSGLFTPISSMPDWAQVMTKFLPVSYYNDAIRTVFLRGGTFTDILPQILFLCLFAAILDLWAVFSYSKKN